MAAKRCLKVVFNGHIFRRHACIGVKLGIRKFLYQIQKITLGISTRSDFRFPRWRPNDIWMSYLMATFYARMYVSGRNLTFICFSIRKKFCWGFQPRWLPVNKVVAKRFLNAIFNGHIFHTRASIGTKLHFHTFFNKERNCRSFQSRRLPVPKMLANWFLTVALNNHISGRNVIYARSRKMLWCFSVNMTSGFQDVSQNISVAF